MKKIVYLINSLKNGGPVNMLYTLIKYMDSDAYEVYVIALKECVINQRDFSNLNCRIITVCERNLVKTVRAVQQIVDEIKPEIVHSHGGVADVVNSRLKGTYKSFSTVHCDPDEDFTMRKGKLIGWIKATFFIHKMKKISNPIACSETVSKKILDKRGIKIEYIRNGIDLEKMKESTDIVTREQIGVPQESIVLVFCGYLSRRKNVRFIARALSDVSREDITFLVLGDGDQLNELQELAKTDKRIMPVGRVSDSYPYLRISDYFISASLSEGLPLAAMEGMACGLPLILSNIESHIELKQRCEKGTRIFSFDTKSEIAQVLQSINKPSETERKAARETVLRELNAKRMADCYCELYNNAIESR